MRDAINIELQAEKEKKNKKNIEKIMMPCKKKYLFILSYLIVNIFHFHFHFNFEFKFQFHYNLQTLLTDNYIISY